MSGSWPAGPWVQFVDRSAGVVTILPAGRPGEIATVKIDTPAGEAAARLISAAPDLAACLKQTFDLLGRIWREEETPTLIRARAALAKAGIMP